MANGWRVVAQKPTERYMPSGQFEDVVEVQVVADDGTYKTLVVPEARYTPQYVAAQADAWYERHQAVAALGNE